MARKNLRYRNFKEVVAAYTKGDLTEPISIHEDECFVSIDRVGRLYENDPHSLLKAALDLLGVPYKRI